MGNGTASRLASTLTARVFALVVAIVAASLALIAPASAAALPLGSAQAFGDNTSGQLGATPGASGLATVGLNKVTTVAGGAAHTLALLDDGTVWSWGSNSLGQLGYQTSALAPSANQTTPRQVTLPGRVTAIAAGASHSLAVVGGTVYAWGDNSSGQLGSPTAIPFQPAPVAGLSGVTKVAAGQGHSLALVGNGSGATIFAWGSNLYGQLGNSTYVPSPTPVQVGMSSVLTTNNLPDNVTDIAAGSNHSLAIAGGQVVAWGNNASGQLGDPDTRTFSSPVPVLSGRNTPGSARLRDVTATAVTAGANHSVVLARTATGTAQVWTFGEDGLGQLGRAAASGTNDVTPTPLASAVVAGVTSVASHGDHTLALLASGRVASWGAGSSGQLGYSVPLGSTATPTLANGITTAIGVATGDRHSIVMVAPTATVAPVSVRFADQIVDQKSATTTITVTNASSSPGNLYVTDVSTVDGTTFPVESTTCISSAGVAPGASCAVKVSFAPLDLVDYATNLNIASNAFGATITVPLSGKGAFPSGTLTIGADETSVPFTPDNIPLAQLPLQPKSPAVATAGNLPLGSLGTIGNLPLGSLGTIGNLPLGSLGTIGNLPLGSLGTIGNLPLGSLGTIGNLPLGSLGTIPLSQLPITTAGGWATILAGSPLANLPLQSVTLRQVMTQNPAGYQQLKIEDLFNFAASNNSVLGSVPYLALLLGKTPLSDISLASSDAGWCARLQNQGHASCGADQARPNTSTGLSASPFELALGGVSFGSVNADGPVPLATLALSNIRLANDAPLRLIPLTSITNLAKQDLGATALSSTGDPTRFFDCAKVSCTTGNLADAERLGAVIAGPTLGALIDASPAVAAMQLGEIGFGFLNLSDQPYDLIPLAQLALGQGQTVVHYHALFHSTSSVAVTNPTMTVTLPPLFTGIAGTSYADLGAGRSAVADPSVNGQILTWRLNGTLAPGGTLQLDFNTRPGFTLGTFPITSARLTDGGSPYTTAIAAPAGFVSVTDPAANRTADLASAMATDTLYLGHTASPSEKHFYGLTLPTAAQQAGTIVSVNLGHLPVDADLSVFYPLNVQSSETPLRAQVTGRPISSLGDEKSRVNDTDTALQPDLRNDVDTSACVTAGGVCQPLALAGVSQNRGTANEVVQFVSPGGSGKFVIEVAGYNGAWSVAPWSLRVRTTAPVTVPVTPRRFTFSYATGTVPAIAAGTKTVFISASSRLSAVYGAAAATSVNTALTSLINDATVGPVIKGAVVDVDKDAATQTAFQAWDQNPGSAALANNVVRAINATVDRAAGVNRSGIQNVVVVGNDEIIPFAKVIDPEVDASERNFAAELAAITGGASSLAGASATGRMATDAPYGDFDPVALAGRFLYVEDVAVSRLVETPANITGTITSYITAKGKVNPTTALTTGYDFLADSATKVQNTLASKVTGVKHLVTPPDAAWDKSALVNQINTGATPDVISLNGHSDPSRTLPPAETTAAGLYTSQDLAAGPSLDRRLVFSVGCHVGLQLPDAVLTSAPTPAITDWAQTVASRGGSLVANTGYGLGSTATIALSEELMSRFADNLGTRPIGQALRDAKQSYVANAGVLDVYDEKTLMQAELYGLPGATFTTPAALPAAPAVPTASLDPATGLQSSTVHAAPTYTQVTDATNGSFYRPAALTTTDGYPVVGGLRSTHNRPVQPQLTVDVTQAAGRAHGALITALTSSDTSGWDPWLERPVVDAMGASPERQFGDIIFPTAIQHVTSALGPNGLRDQLVLVPARFKSDPSSNGRTIGTERLYSSVDARVFYSTSSSWTPPAIASATSAVVGAAATFNVSASPQGGTTLKRVVATFKDASGSWRSVDLIGPAAGGTWTGGAVITGTQVEWFAQAVDSAGNVGLSSNKGQLYTAVTIPAQPANGLHAVINGAPTAANNGWYLQAAVNITGADRIEVSVDGSTFNPYSGTLTLTTDGIHVLQFRGLDSTTNSLVTGSAVVPVDPNAPTAIVTSPVNGGGYLLNQPVTASYTCRDAASGLASCVGTVANGSALDTSSKGLKTFQVVASDAAGNTSTTTISYTVGYNFIGYLNGISNAPTVNVANAGRTIPMKWQLTDGSGAYMTSLSVVTSVTSYAINCATGAPTSSAATTTAGSGLGIDGTTYHYNWSTSSSWANSCRRFVLALDDGTFHTADFKFTT
ncbi:MAG: hypothetical protein QOG03_1099 [Actinomycetota bacterium]|nr:hypothetical protein [Actinomycetota bacterium]